MSTIEIANAVVEKYRGIEGLSTVLLIGSNARGDQEDSSDVDFMCVFSDAVDWPMDVRDGGRHAWCEATKHVEVLFATTDRIRRLMLRDADAGKPYRMECVVEGCVLFGGDSSFAELKKEAAKRLASGPPELTARDRQWEGYEIWCGLERVGGWEDSAVSSLRGYQLLQRMLLLTYALNRKWRPADKHLLRDLPDVDEKVFSLARSYLEQPNPVDLRRMAHHLGTEHAIRLTGTYKSASMPG